MPHKFQRTYGHAKRNGFSVTMPSIKVSCRFCGQQLDAFHDAMRCDADYQAKCDAEAKAKKEGRG